ncbi:MAG: hypothetical protein JW757_09410 [Anaerolineales bacterium]|nr:hypothetical protein [Anaerolineales bacterium]
MSQALNTIQQRIENHFWDVFIPWLEKKPRAQAIVNLGYRFQEQYLNRSTFVFSLLVISLGLMIGLGIGSLLAYLI